MIVAELGTHSNTRCRRICRVVCPQESKVVKRYRRPYRRIRAGARGFVPPRGTRRRINRKISIGPLIRPRKRGSYTIFRR